MWMNCKGNQNQRVRFLNKNSTEGQAASVEKEIELCPVNDNCFSQCFHEWRHRGQLVELLSYITWDSGSILSSECCQCQLQSSSPWQHHLTHAPSPLLSTFWRNYAFVLYLLVHSSTTANILLIVFFVENRRWCYCRRCLGLPPFPLSKNSHTLFWLSADLWIFFPI